MKRPKIQIVTPAARGSRAGNRATAERWRWLLRPAGYRVRITEHDTDRSADVLIALHAWRSADAVASFRQQAPGRPIIVVLTGTDLYRFQHSHPGPTRQAMEAADALVGLHERVPDDVPRHLHHRLHTVFQSARPLSARRPPLKTRFELCVVGHLREEKDSLRAAYAVRDLPDDSRIHVAHYGKAHDEAWAHAAREEMAHNPRYRWHGEVPRWRVRQIMARAQALVMSSRMEGGANAVSEACVAGLPVVASGIPGNIGLLGVAYPGYYPVEETDALRNRLLRIEREPDFLETLRTHCRDRANRFTPEAEQRGLLRVIAQVTDDPGAEGP